MFYSGNNYGGERYAVGYARCEGPLGQCAAAEENPILASDMTEMPFAMGPGHQTIFHRRPASPWLVYHVWQVSGPACAPITRLMGGWIGVDWVDGSPVVLGPTRDPQPVPVTTAP